MGFQGNHCREGDWSLIVRSTISIPRRLSAKKTAKGIFGMVRLPKCQAGVVRLYQRARCCCTLSKRRNKKVTSGSGAKSSSDFDVTDAVRKRALVIRYTC